MDGECVMIAFSKVKRVWLARHRVDFRKQELGLLAEMYRLGVDPFDGDCVIFIGKGKRKIKILYADPTGTWLSKKAFSKEAMKTRFKFIEQPQIKSISWSDLAMLIEGANYQVDGRVSDWPAEDRLDDI